MLSILAAMLMQAAVLAELPPLPPDSLDPRTMGAIRRPQPKDYARLFPRDAMRRDIEGRAMLQCWLGDAGELTRCVVLQETPPGESFGSAAIDLSKLFEFAKTAPDGSATAGRPIRVGIRFNLPGHAHGSS